MPCVRLFSYFFCGIFGGEENLNELKGSIDGERPVCPVCHPLRVGEGEGGIASEALDFRTNEVPYLTSTLSPLTRIRQISQSAVKFLSIKRAGFVVRT